MLEKICRPFLLIHLKKPLYHLLTEYGTVLEGIVNAGLYRIPSSYGVENIDKKFILVFSEKN